MDLREGKREGYDRRKEEVVTRNLSILWCKKDREGVKSGGESKREIER